MRSTSRYTKKIGEEDSVSSRQSARATETSASCSTCRKRANKQEKKERIHDKEQEPFAAELCSEGLVSRILTIIAPPLTSFEATAGGRWAAPWSANSEGKVL
eukprot:768370-Hanusia_phi.AAC.4